MSEQAPRWGRPDPMADPPSPSRLWNLPNGLTMLRLLLVPVFGYLLLAADSDGARWLAALVFVVASLTDLADGAIARSRNLVTTFGKVADPIAALQTVPRGPVSVLIGPEGGFAEAERTRIRSLPTAVAISLGPRIMRADTAAIAALTLVNAVLGDWRPPIC